MAMTERQRQRYGVRATQVGFGVWDAATNGWHGRNDLSQHDAEQLAAKVEARVGAATHSTGAAVRPPDDPKSRPVDPPKTVRIRLGDMWVPGLLYWWAFENGSWVGQVSADHQAKRMWINQRDLRPEGPPEQATAEAPARASGGS